MEKDYAKYQLGYHKDGRMTAFKTEHLVDRLSEKKEHLDFMRKATCFTLTISQRTIPVAGFVHEIDITELWEEYQKIHDDTSRPIKITFNTIMLKMVVECLKAAPILNAHMVYKPFDSRGTLTYKGNVDISMPVILPNGRMLPLLIRDAGNKTLDEMALAVSEIVRKLDNTIMEDSLLDLSFQRVGLMAKQGKILQAIATGIAGAVGPDKIQRLPLKPWLNYRKEVKKEDVITADEIGEGTICVSDVGSIYKGRGFATTSPVLQPTTSCMAYSRVRDEQRVYRDENGEIQIETRKILPFTLLFDHKIGGFPDIVPFLNRMDEIVANPEILHKW